MSFLVLRDLLLRQMVSIGPCQRPCDNLIHIRPATELGLASVHSGMFAWKVRGGGMSAGLPRGAPASTYFTIGSMSRSLSPALVGELISRC